MMKSAAGLCARLRKASKRIWHPERGPMDYSDLPQGVSLLEHTGDIGIEVRAESPESLFVQAAKAMFYIMLETDHPQIKKRKRISVTGEDREQLLVNWLSELNFLAETEGFRPVDYFVSELTDTAITCRVAAGRLNADLYKTQIKAVTFHKLTIRQKDDHWYARVIFDI
ncbi:MAG: archease [candidate division KSB1 bacterium]|nr:archease [candidate division KSB1 bacterium]